MMISDVEKKTVRKQNGQCWMEEGSSLILNSLDEVLGRKHLDKNPEGGEGRSPWMSARGGNHGQNISGACPRNIRPLWQEHSGRQRGEKACRAHPLGHLECCGFY